LVSILILSLRQLILGENKNKSYLVRTTGGNMFSSGYIQNEINKLLSDNSFNTLKAEQNSFNIFETLGVSHLELWHSGVIKWVLNPKSNLDLGDWPLKRFFSLLVIEGESKKAELSFDIADIEGFDLGNMNIENEKYFSSPTGESGKFDIHGEDDRFRLVIENKVQSKEGKDQTIKYYRHIKGLSDGKANILVFLTPDSTQEPKSQFFIKITYQGLCDYVLKPCYNNMKESESKYILGHYINNLGKPLKEGNEFSIMALPNKEQCTELYQRYKGIFEVMFENLKSKKV
jgi:hypothetical protein